MDTKKFIQDRIAERKRAKLAITILREDGMGGMEEFTCYPKDQATKARWLAAYTKKGVTVCGS
jgi:hypothetical protein